MKRIRITLHDAYDAIQCCRVKLHGTLTRVFRGYLGITKPQTNTPSLAPSTIPMAMF
jgi:hypothetical protein